MLNNRDGSVFYTTAAEGYKQGSSAAFLAERAAKTAHCGYAAPPGVATFAKAPEIIFKSVDYSEALRRESLGDCLQCLHLEFSGKNGLQAETSRVL